MPAASATRPISAVEGVDLADQVALAQAADGRVAGHLADRLELVGEQQRARAQPRGRGRGLAAGVAAADDDHVELSFGHTAESGFRPDRSFTGHRNQRHAGWLTGRFT